MRRRLFTRDALEREARTAANVATGARQQMIRAADGTPEGEQRAARYREEADAEELHSIRAREAADTPAWRRKPVATPPGYLARLYGKD
ncbi:hypothetical protein ACGRHY_29955 [Streptomyces sp. HK10]|uniref:hypothetical protein n=1 Tax=Streptomyces sp. HK10 TaxID=3373255 RepID=UPI003749EB74